MVSQGVLVAPVRPCGVLKILMRGCLLSPSASTFRCSGVVGRGWVPGGVMLQNRLRKSPQNRQGQTNQQRSMALRLTDLQR
jgi:hypothetical protein